jgi:chemosensory pili system protein ChpC
MQDIEIRSVMVPVSGLYLLLPNATVAEVVGYSAPLNRCRVRPNGCWGP